MPELNMAESAALSQEYFANPLSYAPFDLVGGRFIHDCIEPKDPKGIQFGQHVVVIQGPGGMAGEGLARAIALTADEGELVTPEEGMEEAVTRRPDDLFRVHEVCTFVGKMLVVQTEMADPSARTLEAMRRMAAGVGHESAMRPLNRVTDASKEQLEYMQSRGSMEHVTEHADNLHPEHDNVWMPDGQGGAYVYVTNFHPERGQNRNTKPADPDKRLLVRGYHDSVAASVKRLNKAAMSGRTRQLNLTANLLMRAATQTVIASSQPGMVFLEARPADTPAGIEIVEQTAVGIS